MESRVKGSGAGAGNESKHYAGGDKEGENLGSSNASDWSGGRKHRAPEH